MKEGDKQADAFYLASATAPYREKQNAAIIASVVDLNRTCLTADYSNSLRAGTTAMRAAIDAVKSGSAERVVVAASDCRLGAPGGKFEQLFGDGAVAITVGSNNVFAEVEEFYSIFNDFTDEWRTSTDPFVRSGESRFIDEVGYLPTMTEAVLGLMDKGKLALSDISTFVFSALNGRLHAQLARKLDLDLSRVQDPLFARIGNTGAPAGLLMLRAALEDAQPGDRILFANYGDGADAFMFRITDSIETIRHSPRLSNRLAAKKSIDYGAYLNWRDLLPFEPSSLPERAEPSLATRWRDRKMVSSLYGVRCRRCGTPQMHPIGQNMRVCVACQWKDDFEPYKFSDKTGKLFTYAIDQLQPTKNPPGLNGVVDFDGGGRLICELTDYDLDKVAIGMPVEMTFRKLSQGKGIINYFWKAKPVW
jgi:3-hydroxy-3-methylglutaryl CoA synthase